MNRIKTRATVGADGMVHLDLNVGEEHVGEEVEVTVEATKATLSVSHEEYQAMLDELHGCIDDPTFEAPPRAPSRTAAISYPPGYRKMTREEWVRFIDRTSGSIDDPTFVRPRDEPLTPGKPLFD